MARRSLGAHWGLRCTGSLRRCPPALTECSLCHIMHNNILVCVMLPLAIYTVSSALHTPTKVTVFCPKKPKGKGLVQGHPSSEVIELRPGAKLSDSAAHEPSGASACVRRSSPSVQKEEGGLQGLINTQENIKAPTELRGPEGVIEVGLERREEERWLKHFRGMGASLERKGLIGASRTEQHEETGSGKQERSFSRGICLGRGSEWEVCSETVARLVHGCWQTGSP